MNKLACMQIFEMQRVWVSFFFFFFQILFRVSFFFFVPPLNSYKTSGTTGLSLYRENSSLFPYTSRGPPMLGGGGDSHYVGRSVDGSKPDMTVKHKAGRN